MKKAFILGAGLGTRLRPLTDKLPKPLVPFYHEPLIVRTLRLCQEAGIEEVMINTHHLAGEWERVFPLHQWESLHLFFSHEPILLDTGGGLKNIAPWVGQNPLLVCNGDILTDISLAPLLEAHEKNAQKGSLATLALRANGHLCNVALNAQAELITDMRHALGVHPGTHQFSGFYCLEPSFLPLIEEGIVSVVPTFLKLIAQQKLAAHLLPEDSLWIDLGTPESYREAHQLISGQKRHDTAFIHPTARVDEASVVGAHCQIGAHCVVENSILWPHTQLSAGTILRDDILLKSR